MSLYSYVKEYQSTCITVSSIRMMFVENLIVPDRVSSHNYFETQIVAIC